MNITRGQAAAEEKKEIDDKMVEKNDGLQPKKPEEIAIESIQNIDQINKSSMEQNDLLLECPIAMPGESDREKFAEDTKADITLQEWKKKLMKIKMVFLGTMEYSRKQYAMTLKNLISN